ncbi:MAG: hypothetical protein IJQ98_03130 [Oscillospiraceae bacterium]|nr:hypothetical protein [Oscillospiraceae bacterium]
MMGISAVGLSSAASGLSALYRDRLSAARSQAYYAANVSAARSAALNPAQPDAPVEPVPPVRAVKPDAAVRMPVAVSEPRLPTVDDLNSAGETLARMRVQYPGEDTSEFNTLLKNPAGIS